MHDAHVDRGNFCRQSLEVCLRLGCAYGGDGWCGFYGSACALRERICIYQKISRHGVCDAVLGSCIATESDSIARSGSWCDVVMGPVDAVWLYGVSIDSDRCASRVDDTATRDTGDSEIGCWVLVVSCVDSREIIS